MPNKFDKILGELRENDFGIGTSIFGGLNNSVLYTDSSGLLASDTLFTYLPTISVRAVSLGSLTDSKQSAFFAKSGSGTQTGTAGFSSSPGNGSLSCAATDSSIPITYVAQVETDPTSGFARLSLSEDLNSKFTWYELNQLRFEDGTGVAPYYIYDNGVETLRLEAGNRILAGSHAFGSGDFDVFAFGNDSGIVHAGLPLRFWWDDSNEWLQFDDGAGTLHTIRAIFSGDGSFGTLGLPSLTPYRLLYTNVVSNVAISDNLQYNGTDLILKGTSTVTSTAPASVPSTTIGAASTTGKTVTIRCNAATTFTHTLASPCVITVSAGSFQNLDVVYLTTTGTFYTGLTAATHYYVRNVSGSTFNVSTTPAGALINTTAGSDTGTHTCTMRTRFTCGAAHGYASPELKFLATTGSLPSALTTTTPYYISTWGLTTTEFCLSTGTNISYLVSTTTAGSGTHTVYGQTANLHEWKDSAGNVSASIDSYGQMLGTIKTTPFRLGFIPADSNYAGVWFSSAALAPTAANYSFLGDPTNTFLNGPTNLWFRCGNVNQAYFSAGYFNFSDNVQIVLGTTTGTRIGNATNQKLAFHGSTAVIQRAGAAQAAVATTAATNVAPYGYTTAAQADAIVTLVNEIRATLVEKGLIKGSA